MLLLRLLVTKISKGAYFLNVLKYTRVTLTVAVIAVGAFLVVVGTITTSNTKERAPKIEGWARRFVRTQTRQSCALITFAYLREVSVRFGRGLVILIGVASATNE